MKQFGIKAISHDAGYCYLARAEGLCVNDSAANRPLLILLEDDAVLGPSDQSHVTIRKSGGGAFSHWGNSLYFSSSDNTDPTNNGKQYVAILTENADDEEAIASLLASSCSSSSKTFASVLSKSISAQGNELHQVFEYRFLLMYLKAEGKSIAGSTCLEVGASPSNGMALCLGLGGAAHVYLNNLSAISPIVDTQYAKNIALLCNLVVPNMRSLDELLLPLGDGSKSRLNPEIFTHFGGLSVSRLRGHVEDVDIIFSFSVFEHIRELPEVSAVLRGMVANDGIGVHAIDARDHSDFSDPLRYLRLSESEFARLYGEDSNRWRYSDYVRIATEGGWEVVKSYFGRPHGVCEGGVTNCYDVMTIGPESFMTTDMAQIALTVTEEARAQLDPAFRSYTREELSANTFTLVCRPGQK